ncbi:ATP-binding protein [Streptomyces sp. PSKA54]|uniref:ATP-binding protein n=1 Tax=Streptomyces himalayensis subsp. aureolus TaxID=2758039 RepID=A0A7W2D315_9ACTN|nr:ATP-binding protein [Streptomyces himalayensis]MBA4863811.1 ATP-binding protein [Streptomyces himalayensis subsp. aureolus]
MSAEPVEGSIDAPQIAATWEWMCWAVDGIGPPAPGHSHSVTSTPEDRHGPVRCSALALPPEPRSAHIARDFTRAALVGRTADERIEDVAVTVSELVSNALRYGRIPSVDLASQSSVWLAVWDRWSCVVCAVTDAGNGIPFVKQADEFAESGRGLQVVSALSDAWGWSPRADRGKVVWAMFLL